MMSICLLAPSLPVLLSHIYVCLATYDLDPAHYYIAPGLAWDAALKSTQIKLDAETGYILEVDLEYPQRPDDTHNDYPLAPETIRLHKTC